MSRLLRPESQIAGGDILYVPQPDKISAIAQAACGGLVVFDNVVVHAMLGSAHNPVQEQISQAKGEARGTKQPVGCTMPFDVPLLEQVFDARHINDAKLQALHMDPSEQTRRLGGITFLRGPLSDDNDHIPDCMISLAPEGSPTARVLQVYSPEGNVWTERLLRKMIEMGGQPVMTSANKSGEPEIFDRDKAMAFANEHDLPYATFAHGRKQQARPQGSYPIGQAQYNQSTREWEFVWVRTGCFDPELLMRLVNDMPARIDEHRKMPDPKYPDNILRLRDVSKGRLRLHTAKGSELRTRILDAMRVAA